MNTREKLLLTKNELRILVNILSENVHDVKEEIKTHKEYNSSSSIRDIVDESLQEREQLLMFIKSKLGE